jgi:hypothetical protein
MHLNRIANNVKRYKVAKKTTKQAVSEARVQRGEGHLKDDQKQREEDERHHPS